jgi:alkylation response protein AidB-like acyl-CoA dehydrogenase
MVLAGPRENVLVGQIKSPDAPTGAGGLQTSALALGLSYAALDYLRCESVKRNHLLPIVDRFHSEHESLHQKILTAASGDSETDSGLIRTTANGLVQRTTAAAMTTAKGAGLMVDHPVGRWCQQAFFFLVWSCPQPVAEAHLCELVGLT